MPANGINSDSSGCDAAQDLLGLQNNLQGTDRENSNRYKAPKVAKFNCKCFITFDVPKQPTAASPQQAADAYSSTNSDVATSKLTGPVAGTSLALKKRLLQRHKTETANNRDVTSVETQTEDTAEDECSLIKEMELIISQRDETIKMLREQIEALEHVTETVNKEDTREMSMDVSDSAKPDVVEPSVTDAIKNVKSKVQDRNLRKRANDMVPIGSGNTMIPTKIYQSINWSSYTRATRKLLTTAFSRSVLATHSLTGRPSPAFPEKTIKKKLNETLVNDIIKTVAQRCCVTENLVRHCITITCADESKRLRNRENRAHKENIPPESDSD